MEEALNFVCPSKDCSQRVFSDEKQLISHKKKHDMVLCLNKSSQYSSDQTPTPTRFIRNCEAIGLFQDLQKVNPFDENFKKATEAVKKGERVWMPSVSSLGRAAGDDLHTPHVGLSDDTESSNNGNEHEDVEDVVQSEDDTSLRTSTVVPQTTTIPLSDESNGGSTSSAQDLRVLVRISDGVLVQLPAITENFAIPNCQRNSSTPAILIPPQTVHNGGIKSTNLQPKPPEQPHTAASAVVKQKLKAALLKTIKAADGGKQKSSLTDLPMFPNQRSSADIVSTTEAKKDKKVTSSTSANEDCDRKRKTLERNRIAAMRCREKRKKWVAELREKYEKMCKANAVLVAEVTSLRSEVARLKGLLIASCSQNQIQDLTATTVQLVPSIPTKKRLVRQLPDEDKGFELSPNIEGHLSSSSVRVGRENLRLDIEGATRATVMDLDSPLVRSDEILSSVAPPTTPNERLISFPELDRVGDSEMSEEKMLPTVIQINPNALTKLPSGFS